ncbi:hypothetical protein AB0D29_30920 [Streptomyces sp. NPDC048424]|uniref:hypothetical protein n=1 Tax=Streptomyces sp. NPDC048424 TaxID=3155265 RepID=UPI00342258D9
MRVRVRAGMRGSAAVAAAAVLAFVTAGPAASAEPWRPRPGTLYISDIRLGDGVGWSAPPVQQGWGASYDCLEDWSWQRPEVNVWHREFTTAETATAEQKVVVFATEAEAVAFADAARQNYADCPRRRNERPDLKATGYDHGVVNVEEGATLQGMSTFDTDAQERPDFNYLWGVSRDGDTVTLVRWSSYWGAPPVAAWKNVLRTAVNKLY